jgi:hypothetical protein
MVLANFEIVAAPSTDRTDQINLHITKTHTRAYWQNYTAGVELWWGMRQLKDRQWVADYTIANFTPPNLMRCDYQHFDDNSYLVIPLPKSKSGDSFGYSLDTWCTGEMPTAKFPG